MNPDNCAISVDRSVPRPLCRRISPPRTWTCLALIASLSFVSFGGAAEQTATEVPGTAAPVVSPTERTAPESMTPAPIAPPLVPPASTFEPRDPIEGPDLMLEDPQGPPVRRYPDTTGRGSAVVDFIEPTGVPSLNLDEAKANMRVRFVPSFQITATFDDNIFIQRHHKEADLYHSVLAGAAIGYGDFRDAVNQLGSFQQGYEGLRSPEFDDRRYAFASYTPGFTIFADHSDENTFDQVALVGVKWDFGRLATTLSGDFRQFSEAFVDSGTREQTKRLQVELAAKYAFTDRTSLEVDLYQFTRLFENQTRIDSKEWVDQNYLNYDLSATLKVAAGLRLGYLDTSRGPAQKYEQAVLRLKYDSLNKLKANLFGGVEFRQIGSDRESTNPIFGFDATYAPRDGTLFALSGARQVTNSIDLIDENVTTSRVWLSASQRLFQKTNLTLQAGYENREYDSSGTRVGPMRTDNIFVGSLEYSFHLTKWTAISLAYNCWISDSNVDRYNFTDNRATVRFDLLF